MWEDRADEHYREIMTVASEVKWATLLYRATHCVANIGEYVVGIRSDQPNRTHHDDKNHRQHDRILGDVLSGFFVPQAL